MSFSHSALNEAAQYLKPMADACYDRFGMVVSIIMSGPIGSLGGKIEVRRYVEGLLSCNISSLTSNIAFMLAPLPRLSVPGRRLTRWDFGRLRSRWSILRCKSLVRLYITDLLSKSNQDI